jgi:hypothetical protein
MRGPLLVGFVVVILFVVEIFIVVRIDVSPLASTVVVLVLVVVIVDRWNRAWGVQQQR